MKTSRRICRPGLTCQVRSRCIELRPMLREEGTKELMLQVIAWAQEKYNSELHVCDIMKILFQKTILLDRTKDLCDILATSVTSH